MNDNSKLKYSDVFKDDPFHLVTYFACGNFNKATMSLVPKTVDAVENLNSM